MKMIKYLKKFTIVLSLGYEVFTMSSRMSKYYEEDAEMPSRYHKNEDLYKEINKNEIDNFEIKSNSTLLGENKNEIDVEKIKKILDTKYNETPQRKSIRLEEEKEEEPILEDTKEYDINVVLEKAKEQKDDNYEEERLKQIRNTQFDILKNLNVEEKETDDDDIGDDDDDTTTDTGMNKDSLEEENLKSLINTIAFNEHKNNEHNASLDILSDLKGDDNTEVLDGLKEEMESLEDEEEESSSKESKEVEMTNSFYTSSNALRKKDFEELDDDFKDTVEVNGVFLKIVIVIIVLVFLVGIALLIKSLFFS